MSQTAARPRSHDDHRVLAGSILRFGQIAFMLGLQAAILLLLSGKPAWLWAWVYLGVSVGNIAVNASLLLSSRTEHLGERLAERATGVAQARDWDKVVSGIWALAQYLLLPSVAALHVRFGWPHEPGLPAHLLGAVVYAIGSGLFSWAMIVNAYFSTGARIQPGQTVCSSGPYRFVRHPGYVGAILQSVGLPALLGSWWAYVPAVAAVLAMVVRAALEDGMLHTELAGYPEYAVKVRYRLLPGLW